MASGHGTVSTQCFPRDESGGEIGGSGTTNVFVSGSTISNNNTGLNVLNSANLMSRGNNTLAGNNTDLAGTVGTFGGQ